MCICSRKYYLLFFFSSRRRHTISLCDWSSDVCSSDLEDFVRLLHEGVIVRPMKLYGFPTSVRVTVGTHPDNERFLEALRSEERRVGKECISRCVSHHYT